MSELCKSAVVFLHGPGNVLHQWLFALAFGCLVPGFAAAQSVTPDGSTATTTVVEAGGRTLVNIAPATNGISLNRYSDFNVPVAGVALNNQNIAAGTIINEVTSQNRTTISGELAVIGPSANLIVANPNGVTVNGGRITNAVNAALVAGNISVDGTGRVTGLLSAQGDIQVGARGLTGTMAGLDLVARSIASQGSLAAGDPARLGLLAGGGQVQFDTNAGAGGTFVVPTALGAASTDVLVEIGQQATLSGGRISIAVTGNGAGVRHSGAVAAGANGFQLTASGRIELPELAVQSQGSVLITGGSVNLASNTGRSVIASTDSGVVLQSSSGSVNVANASLQGLTIAGDSLASDGGVTIVSSGDISLAAANGSEPLLQSGSSNVVLLSGGRTTMTRGALNAAEDVRVSSGSDVSLSSATLAAGQDIRLQATNAVLLGNTSAEAQDDIRIDGGNITLNNDDAGQAVASVNSVAGGVVMRTTTGGLTNRGVLVEGESRTVGDAQSVGAVTILSAGEVLLESLDANRLAAFFARSDDLVLDIDGALTSRTGRLLSNRSMTIDVDGAFLNETILTGDVRNLRIVQQRRGRTFSSLFLRRRTTTRVDAAFGTPVIPGEVALVLALEGLNAQAASMRNLGGSISGRSVSLRTAGVLENSARLTGAYQYVQSCSFMCRSGGSSGVGVLGGDIRASQDATIVAGTRLTLRSGTISGNTALSINAPVVDEAPLLFPSLLVRPAGFGGIFGGGGAWTSLAPLRGQFASLGGRITLDGDIVVGSTDFITPFELVILGTLVREAPPLSQNNLGRSSIGLLFGLF